MSVRFMSTHVVNTLSFRLYMSHFPTGLVSSKKKIVAMTFAPTFIIIIIKLAALAKMVACLPLVQQVRGSIPGGIVNFLFENF